MIAVAEAFQVALFQAVLVESSFRAALFALFSCLFELGEAFAGVELEPDEGQREQTRRKPRSL
jgi:hypothetical protein